MTGQTVYIVVSDDFRHPDNPPEFCLMTDDVGYVRVFQNLESAQSEARKRADTFEILVAAIE